MALSDFAKFWRYGYKAKKTANRVIYRFYAFFQDNLTNKFKI